MNSSLLSVQNLTVKFGGLTALNNFSIEVAVGKPVGLIGPNGAGKTTVFNIVTGVYKPANGSVELNGKNLVGHTANEIAEHGIARTFQNIRLFSGMSVQENLIAAASLQRKGTLFSSIFYMPKARMIEALIIRRAHYLLEFVQLSHLKDEQATSLPYGSQRKLEIARALMLNPKVLLLDEPAAGMNPTEKTNLREIVAQIPRLNIGVLLIEHDMSFVMSLCGSITVLDYGQVIAVGEPAAIQRNSKVIEAYLGVAPEDVPELNLEVTPNA